MFLFYFISVSAKITSLFWILECTLMHLILSVLESELCTMFIKIFVTFLLTAECVVFDKI